MKRRRLLTVIVVCGLGVLAFVLVSRRTPLYELDELCDRTGELGLQAKDGEIIKLCSRFLASDPDSAQVHHDRGYAHLCLEHYDEAIEDFDTAIKLKPDLARAYVDRAYVHEYGGEYEQARQDLDRAIALSTEAL